MISGIYKITVGPKDKVYIGQSIDIDTRIKQHKSLLKNNKHYNYKMQNLFNKTNTFDYEILEYTSSTKELYSLEEKYITIYDSINNGLNICSAGITGRGLSHPSTKYTKEQIVGCVYLLLDINNKIKDISDITGVSVSTIRHISRGEVHHWLFEEFPIEMGRLMECAQTRLRNSSQRNLESRYKFTKLKAPDGTVHNITGSVAGFAREHSLDGNKLGQVLLGNRTMHKGWIGYKDGR